jgi:hypothetical protein
MNRGDVILVRFPHPSGLRGKKRPAVVVQSDAYAGSVSTVIVAEVTKNLTMARDPACLFIDTSTPEGKATGLVRDRLPAGCRSRGAGSRAISRGWAAGVRPERCGCYHVDECSVRAG